MDDFAGIYVETRSEAEAGSPYFVLANRQISEGKAKFLDLLHRSAGRIDRLFGTHVSIALFHPMNTLFSPPHVRTHVDVPDESQCVHLDNNALI